LVIILPIAGEFKTVFLIKKLYIVFIITLLGANLGFSQQQIKKYYDEGIIYLNEKKYPEAIKKFSNIIKLSKDYKDVYLKRAIAYEGNKDFNEAAEDYFTAATLYNKSKAENYFNSGKLFLEIKNYNKAIISLDKCCEIDKKNAEAFELKTIAYLALKKYESARYESSQVLKFQKSATSYYYHALSAYYLHDLIVAEEDALKAIRLKVDFTDAFILLAEIYYTLNKQDKALEMSNKAIIFNPNSSYYYFTRSKIHFKRNSLNEAIIDLSEILTRIEPHNIEALYTRASYYELSKQPSLAIGDYTKIISIDANQFLAIYFRAKNYEILEINNFAIKDYQHFLNVVLSAGDTLSAEANYSRERIFILNKESNIPEISIKWPIITTNSIIEIADNKDTLTISGIIFDQSELKFFKINGNKVVIVDVFGQKYFAYTMTVKNVDQIIIEAEDIYNNYEFKRYNIIRTETEQPRIHLLNPYASDNDEIYLESNSSAIFIEGKVTDQSKIKSIIIDDVSASFKQDEINPVFTAVVKITNKATLTIIVTDIYGNTTQKVFIINREGINLLADNPMGKTWVIFIQNTAYEFMPILKGPTKDAEKIKAALAGYHVNNFIIKKNMNKQDMQRFFLIELRDLIKNNQVNSLMIWFAGHGKYMNEMGYWLPVNALPYDEFTYFPVHTLKSNLQIYSNSLKHILVITDACDAGPSFTMVIRADSQEPDCSDWTYASLRSAQVFTSTSQGWASDQSVFADAFAESLLTNTHSCISIDQISEFVTNKVKSTLKQNPVFGKIAGLEDEDGTFFFIKTPENR